MPAHNFVTNQTNAQRNSAAGITTLTQTYATADATLANNTSAALVLTDTGIAAATASATLTDSSSTNPTEAEFNQLAKDVGTAYNALLVDFIDLKQFVNKLADACQNAGIAL